MARRAFKEIRDPVYDYVPFTPIEQSIIDRPEFQRLHFILQNSACYVSYPSTKNTRFPHSLGTMHLAGRMFESAVTHARHDHLHSFIVKVVDYLRNHTDHLLHVEDQPSEVVSKWETDYGCMVPLVHRPLTGQVYDLRQTIEDYPAWFVLDLVWQAVRLCGLIHDLGHLPLSHLFESAIDRLSDLEMPAQFRESVTAIRSHLPGMQQKLPRHLANEAKVLMARCALHERLGIGVFSSFAIESRECGAQLAQLLAIDACHVDPRPPELGDIAKADVFAVPRFIHSIIDGDLDADRLDYCVRDPQTAGLETGAVDTERIVNNLCLWEVGGQFRAIPSDKAASGIEAFYHQRFLTYKYMIYHHNVVRYNNAIQEVIVRLIREAITQPGDDMIKRTLEEFDFWDFNAGGGQVLLPLAKAGQRGDESQIIYLDDGWLRTLFCRLHRRLKSANKIESAEGHTVSATEYDTRRHLLFVLLDTVLFRRSVNMWSPWKRDSEFQDWERQICERLRESASRVHGVQPFRIAENSDRRRLLIACITKEWERKFPDGPILLWSHVRPKIIGDLEMLTGKSDESAHKTWLPQKVDEVSPYLALLREAVRTTPDVQFALLAKNIKGRHDERQRWGNNLLDFMTNYVYEVLRFEQQDVGAA